MSDGERCVLEPGASVQIPVWFKGPEIVGDHDLDILFYYESEPVHPKLRQLIVYKKNWLQCMKTCIALNLATCCFYPFSKIPFIHKIEYMWVDPN